MFRQVGSFIWLLALALMYFMCSVSYSGEYYTWTDESGNIHISDSLESVPAQYRNQVKRKTFENEEPAEPSDNTSSQQGLQPDEKDSEKPKKHEVPYVPYGESAKRVIINVVFNGTVTAKLAIDTGAPGTVISPGLAKKIGLFDEEQGQLQVMAGGIGGAAPAVRSIVDRIQVGGAKIDFVPVTIIPSISTAFEGLLGLDFVSSYNVTIDSRRKVVVFEELPKDTEHPGGHDQEWWTGLFREFAESRSKWKAYRDALDKKIRESMYSVNSDDEASKAFAENQYREAEKLFDKLDRYARENAVPLEWRK